MKEKIIEFKKEGYYWCKDLSYENTTVEYFKQPTKSRQYEFYMYLGKNLEEFKKIYKI